MSGLDKEHLDAFIAAARTSPADFGLPGSPLRNMADMLAHAAEENDRLRAERNELVSLLEEPGYISHSTTAWTTETTSNPKSAGTCPWRAIHVGLAGSEACSRS